MDTSLPDHLPLAVRDYLEGGAGDEDTLRANERAWRGVKMHQPARLRPAAAHLLAEAAAPLLLAPCALARLAHPDGESGVARAAAAANVPMIASTTASETLEETADAAPGANRWFQLYAVPDRAIVADLIARAETAGYRALVLTVDTPVLGRRERDLRSGFRLPDGIRVANLERYGRGLEGYAAERKDAALAWDIVGWIRERTALPLLLKGILDPVDADRAAGMGVDGVIVSNHGGRQLDGASATAEALPWIADAIGDRTAVLVDGGIRSPGDVVRARCLGADAALIGRPWVRTLACGGSPGLAAALSDWIRALRWLDGRYPAP